MSYLKEAIELHDTLNPAIWNEDNTLREDVLQKLLSIYSEFIKFIEIPLNIVDVEIVGSNASYNYNEQSDIDLHVIVNSEVNFMDETLLQQFYNCRKGSFNDKYDLSINDIPIELYIEDVNSGNATNGRYSIIDNNWVLFPKPLTFDIPDISQNVNNCVEKAYDLIARGSAEEINSYINELYMMRKLGLSQEGEASVGNLTFKELRNRDIFKDLKDRYYELKSSELSL